MRVDQRAHARLVSGIVDDERRACRHSTDLKSLFYTPTKRRVGTSAVNSASSTVCGFTLYFVRRNVEPAFTG
jgi:hypothetical protein